MSIERADLEAKFRQVQGAVDDTKSTAKSAGVGLAVAAVVVVLLVYFFGRRKGRKGGAQLEVYRLS